MFINNNKTGKVFFITLNFIMKSSPTIFSSSPTFFAVVGDRPNFLKFLESTLNWKTIAFTEICVNMLYSYFWVSHNIVKLQTCSPWHN